MTKTRTVYHRVGGFGNSDEAEAIEELLQAYDQSDADQIKTIVSKPLFRNLENEVCNYLLSHDLVLCVKTESCIVSLAQNMYS